MQKEKHTITRKQHQPLLLLFLFGSRRHPILPVMPRAPAIPQIQQRPPKLTDRDILLLWFPRLLGLLSVGVARRMSCWCGILLADAVDVVECEDGEADGRWGCHG